LVTGPIYLPEQKALLSRDGGVCAHDGSRLRFDPFSPHRHECPSCGEAFEGDLHHRAWSWRYHVWLSERAIHCALLHGLGLYDEGAERAEAILLAYADRYRTYPNRDNVLGPTRLFFSTYQESIWLIQIAIAVGLMARAGHRFTDAAREQVEAMVAESARLIMSFDEWWSNRQVWNSTALIAAGQLLRLPRFVERGVENSHGVIALMERAVSADGRWVEGENYHFFALRAFAFARQLLEQIGGEWSQRLPGARLARMYVAPLAGVLPDLTLPARGDSPYGVSLQQPRFAELWEVGWAHTGAAQMESLLSALYGLDAPPLEEYLAGEIAEVESNRPARRMRRDQLGWQGLLWMSGSAPDADPEAWKSGSLVMSSAGPAILRQGKDRHVALECGGTGSGHGHPDALHLSLHDGRPWFSDFGTGSYVSKSLHWFRSALCHNAPGLVGVGQRGRRGWCSGFAAAADWSWCQGSAPELFGPEFTATRTLIAGPDYTVDVVDLAAPDHAVVDLPIHPLGTIELAGSVVRRDLEGLDVFGGVGHEHGYDAVQKAVELNPAPSGWIAKSGQDALQVLFAERSGETVLLATAPGPPNMALGESEPMEFFVRRAAGTGRWIQLYTTCLNVVDRVWVDGTEIVVTRSDDSEDRIALRTDGVRIHPASGDATHLGGLLPEPPARPSGQGGGSTVRLRCPLLSSPPTLDAMFSQIPTGAVVPLGALNYRRSEQDYPGESVFSARVGLCAAGTRVYFAIDVRKPELVFAPADATALALDNETPDIHADGIQFYVGWDAWRGYLVLPLAGEPDVRVRPVNGTGAVAAKTDATWRKTSTGYQMLISCDVGERINNGQEFLVNLIVNEMLPDRERRAGQLALVGGGGWVYLRGDREPAGGAAIAEVR
jgi:hypothetical protein